MDELDIVGAAILLEMSLRQVQTQITLGNLTPVKRLTRDDRGRFTADRRAFFDRQQVLALKRQREEARRARIGR